MVEELKRTYVVPLRRRFVNTPKYKRTNKAVRVLKEFIIKHMKAESVKLGPALNDFLWVKGIKNPPGKVTVDAERDKNGVVRVELKGVKYVDFKLVDKVNKNASLKEKLQSKVSSSKEDKPKKQEKKAEKAVKAEKKETAKVATPKPATTPTKKEVPSEKETAKTEDKKEAKADAKAEVKTEAKPKAASGTQKTVDAKADTKAE